MLHTFSLRSLTVLRGKRSETWNTTVILSATARLRSCLAAESEEPKVLSTYLGLGLFSVSKMLKSGDNRDTVSSSN